MTFAQPVRLATLALLLVGALVPAQEEPQPVQAPVVAWAPDGKVLVAANGLLARFELDSAREELLDDAAISFAFSPNGDRLAVASLKGLVVRGYPDFESRVPVMLPLSEGGAGDANRAVGLYSLAWSPDGTTLAAGTVSGHTLLWDTDSGELWADVGVDPPSPAVRLTFSADSRRLLSAFEDGRGVLWDIKERTVVQQFSVPQRGQKEEKGNSATMVLSPDGDRVLATWLEGEEAEMLMLNRRGGVAWQRSGYGVQFTPDGAAVVSLAPPFRIAALYRTSDAQALRTFEPPEGVRLLHAVRLSPQGTQLLGVGEDFYGQIMIVWDFATARIRRTRR